MGLDLETMINVKNDDIDNVLCASLMIKDATVRINKNVIPNKFIIYYNGCREYIMEAGETFTDALINIYTNHIPFEAFDKMSEKMKNENDIYSLVMPNSKDFIGYYNSKGIVLLEFERLFNHDEWSFRELSDKASVCLEYSVENLGKYYIITNHIDLPFENGDEIFALKNPLVKTKIDLQQMLTRRDLYKREKENANKILYKKTRYPKFK